MSVVPIESNPFTCQFDTNKPLQLSGLNIAQVKVVEKDTTEVAIAFQGDNDLWKQLSLFELRDRYILEGPWNCQSQNRQITISNFNAQASGGGSASVTVNDKSIRAESTRAPIQLILTIIVPHGTLVAPECVGAYEETGR